MGAGSKEMSTEYAIKLLQHDIVVIDYNIKRIKQKNRDEGRPPSATYDTHILEANKLEAEKAIEILKAHDVQTRMETTGKRM